LRQLNSAAQQYYLEHGAASVTYGELVGTDKYIKTINVVAGENYSTLPFTQEDTVLSIVAPNLPDTMKTVTFNN
jgi:hypothetical protein